MEWIERILHDLWEAVVRAELWQYAIAALVATSSTLVDFFVRPRIRAWLPEGLPEHQRVVLENYESYDIEGTGEVNIELERGGELLRAVCYGARGVAGEGLVWPGAKDALVQSGTTLTMKVTSWPARGTFIVELWAAPGTCDLRDVRVRPGGGWDITPRVDMLHSTGAKGAVRDAVEWFLGVVVGVLGGLLTCILVAALVHRLADIPFSVAETEWKADLWLFAVYVVLMFVVRSMVRGDRHPPVLTSWVPNAPSTTPRADPPAKRTHDAAAADLT